MLFYFLTPQTQFGGPFSASNCITTYLRFVASATIRASPDDYVYFLTGKVLWYQFIDGPLICHH